MGGGQVKGHVSLGHITHDYIVYLLSFYATVARPFALSASSST